MERTVDPVDTICFQSAQQFLDWLANKEEVQNLMQKYPPELYSHNVCVLCKNPRVVIRAKYAVPVTLH